MASETSADALERMVDAEGVTGVLDMLANICGDKASHIREAWQDEALAIRWDRVASLVDRCRARCAHIQDAM